MIALINIPSVLAKIRPGARWFLQGEDYEGLDWRDEAQQKPTLSEIEAAWLGVLQLNAIKQIDADVDAIYQDVVGNRSSEYELTEKGASAFAAGSYMGAPPQSILAWATAKGRSNQWAADDVIATAAGWRSAQILIRTNRLTAKELIRNATNSDQVDAAEANWESFKAVIRTNLGV